MNGILAVPKKIRTAGGTQYTAQMSHDLANLLGIEHLVVAPSITLEIYVLNYRRFYVTFMILWYFSGLMRRRSVTFGAWYRKAINNSVGEKRRNERKGLVPIGTAFAQAHRNEKNLCNRRSKRSVKVLI